MATYTLTPLEETDDLSEKHKYLQVSSYSDFEALQPPDNRVDNFSRLCTVEMRKIEPRDQFRATANVTISRSRGRALMNGESLSCRIRFSTASGKFLEVAVTHNFPYVGRENITTRSYDGTTAKEVATGRNFNLNSWDESPYSLGIDLRPSRMDVEVNNGWHLSGIAGVSEPIHEVRVYRVFRTVDTQAYPGKYPDDIIEKFKASVAIPGERGATVHRLLKITRKAFTFSRTYVNAVTDDSLVVATLPKLAENNVTRPSTEVEKLQMVGTLDKLIMERGKAVYETPDTTFAIKEDAIFDERYMDKREALLVNSRLNRLLFAIGGDGSLSDKGTFLVGVIQLFLLYSTVKYPTLNPAYKVDIMLKRGEVPLSFQSVRQAIIDGEVDNSNTNKVRTYMRYYANTAVSLLLAGKVVPAYTAAAKHGVPKKYLPFCFDFAVLDSRHYTQDVLKANALASAYAIKLAKEKGIDKEQYNILST